MKKIFPLLLSILFFACQPQQSTQDMQLQTGIWRMELDLGETILPFNFELSDDEGNYQMVIHNGEERLKLQSFEWDGDSIHAQLAVFDSRFEGKMLADDRIEGFWFDDSRKGEYKIPFVAMAGKESRYEVEEAAKANELIGKWEVHFSPQTEEETPAIGLFEEKDGRIHGTFVTETGDYRFLEGVMDGQSLKLSTFDGAHAFAFEAKWQEDSSLVGTFWSGTHWKESWVAQKNPDFQLRNPDSLTYLKEGYDQLSFSFPKLDGDSLHFPSAAYDGKVVIVQVLGSWCPNCMDETRLFAEWYEQYHEQGLEVIGIAYERSEDLAGASQAIKRLQADLGVKYPIVFGGKASKSIAAESLPMLNHLMSFPTSIFIDQSGKIQKIHTGFNGPGTGEYYDRFVQEYEGWIQAAIQP